MKFNPLKSSEYIYIYLPKESEKFTKVSPNQIIRTILTKEMLDQNNILLI